MYIAFFKRFIDILLAVIGIPLLTIILVIVAPIIYFEDKSSIFYRALRLGKDGKVFLMYKFRSMKVNAPDIRNADGSTYNGSNDIRVTKIGKFLRKTSLDEAPQLYNVLKGDMSVIGPRPDLPEHFEDYSNIEKRKLEIKPGITGFSQAYYRNTIPWKERIQHDIYYIDNMSFWLDIKIFLKTVVSVFSRKGIYVQQPEMARIRKLEQEKENIFDLEEKNDQ